MEQYEFDGKKTRVIELCDQAIDYIQKVKDKGVFKLETESAEESEPAKEQDIDSIVSDIKEAAESLKSGKFQVAVIGQMKAGKSTLLNAMIFRDEVLPSAATPQTAKLTVINYGDTSTGHVNFYSREEWNEIRTASSDNKYYRDIVDSARQQVGTELESLLGTRREIALGELKDYVASYDEEKDQGKYVNITGVVELEYELDKSWPREVMFVDTPGTNDPDEKRERVTLDYLSKADAVLMVLYGGRPGDREDIQFLKNTLLPVGFAKIIVAVNKSDMIPEENRGAITEYIKELFTGALNETGEENTDFGRMFNSILDLDRIHAISGIQALLGRTEAKIANGKFHWKKSCKKKGIETFEEAERKSGVPELEETLKDFLLHGKGKAMLKVPLSKSLSNITKTIRKTNDNIMRLDQRIDNMDRQIEELRAEYENSKSQLQKINDAIADLRASINTWVKSELYQAGRECSRMIKDFVSEIHSVYMPRIDGIGALKVLFSLNNEVERLNSDLKWRQRGLTDDLIDVLNNSFRVISGKIGSEIEEKLRENIPDFTKSPMISDLIEELGRTDPQLSLNQLEGAQATSGSSGLTKVAALAPVAYFVPVAGILGGLLMGVFSIGQKKADIKNALETASLEYEKKAMNYIKDNLSAEVTEQAWRNIDPLLEEIKSSVKNQINDLEMEMKKREDAEQDVETEKKAIREMQDSIKSEIEKGNLLKEKIEKEMNGI